jgi:DNA repair photolyase
MARQIPLIPDAAPQPTLRDVADAVRAAGIDALPDARRRADEARYQEVQVRSALTRTTGMPFPWALNPYRGCTHGCEYCYARKYQRHLELGSGDDFSSFILVKRNLPEVLGRELARASWTRDTVAIGTATDAYQPIEGHYRLTRRCLEAFAAARTPVSIVTKGPMIVRDADVLAEVARAARCRVYMSVPSVDEEAWTRLEPGTASPAQRLRAVRQLLDAGIETGVLMMPLVPGITTSRSSIARTLRAVADAGATVMGASVARLDPDVRDHFFGFLERAYPALLEGYRRLYTRTNPPAEYSRAVQNMVRDARNRVSSSITGNPVS